jgi:hypothetical protein
MVPPGRLLSVTATLCTPQSHACATRCQQDSVSYRQVLVQIGVEADNKAVSHPEGGCPQVAAGPHGLLQDEVLFIPAGIEGLHLFSLCRGDAFGGGQQFPGRRLVDFLLARIGGLVDGDAGPLQRCQRFFTGGSPLPQIGPVDLFHPNPPSPLRAICGYGRVFVDHEGPDYKSFTVVVLPEAERSVEQDSFLSEMSLESTRHLPRRWPPFSAIGKRHCSRL